MLLLFNILLSDKDFFAQIIFINIKNLFDIEFFYYILYFTKLKDYIIYNKNKFNTKSPREYKYILLTKKFFLYKTNLYNY